jgi:hypothetical protein
LPIVSRKIRQLNVSRKIRQLNAKAVTLSGLAAGAAFVAVLEADLRLTGRNVDDLMILGCPFTEDPTKARAVGMAIHVVNSLALASLYATLEGRLPGPGWVKGVIFANVENVILYWPAFWQSVPRHIAFGVVLGVLYDRLGLGLDW